MLKKMALVVVLLLGLGVIILLFVAAPDKSPSLNSAVNLGSRRIRDIDILGQTLVRVSDEEENKIGQAIAQEIIKTGSVITDTPELHYVEAVGNLLIPYVNRPKIKYHFYIYRLPEINAFSSPGGHIFITPGMLSFLETESELAMVLGHEMIHVDLRHTIERVQYEIALKRIGLKDLAMVGRLGSGVLRLGFTKELELEADRYGLERIIKARYHPQEALNILIRMADTGQPNKPQSRNPVAELGLVFEQAIKEYMTTHPPIEKRIELLEKMLNQNKNQLTGKFYRGRENYQSLHPRTETEYPEEWSELR